MVSANVEPSATCKLCFVAKVPKHCRSPISMKNRHCRKVLAPSEKDGTDDNFFGYGHVHLAKT